MVMKLTQEQICSKSHFLSLWAVAKYKKSTKSKCVKKTYDICRLFCYILLMYSQKCKLFKTCWSESNKNLLIIWDANSVRMKTQFKE